VLVANQQSAGKSFFLSYALVRRLIAAKTTLVQLRGVPHLYRFDENGVTAILSTEIRNGTSAFLKDPETWVLIDGGPLLALYQPWIPRCMLLQAASPEVAKFPREKDLSMMTYFLDIRSWKEVVCGQ
jgi:hypothetical protein